MAVIYAAITKVADQNKPSKEKSNLGKLKAIFPLHTRVTNQNTNHTLLLVFTFFIFFIINLIIRPFVVFYNIFVNSIVFKAVYLIKATMGILYTETETETRAQVCIT